MDPLLKLIRDIPLLWTTYKKIEKVVRSSLVVGEQDFTQLGKPVTRYTNEIKEAKNARWECPMQAESKVAHLIEESFND